MEKGVKKKLFSQKTERMVIGSILENKSALISVLEKLKEEDFFDRDCNFLYKKINKIYNKNRDELSVIRSKIVEDEEVISTVGSKTVLEIIDEGTYVFDIEPYVKMLKSYSVRRKLLNYANNIVDSCTYEDDIDDVLNLAENGLLDISLNNEKKGLVHVSEALISAKDIMQEAALRDGDITGISSGFSDLDRKILGLNKSDLILIAGRPGMGKTVFGLNLAHNSCTKSNATAAFFSLEMSKEQIVQRLLAAHTNTDLTSIKSGKLDESDWDRIKNGSEELSEMKFYIDDSFNLTVNEILSKARRLKMQSGLDLIVIDYLQLMESSKKTENRVQEISSISRALKQMAKELDCPVIALSQLSREVEKRADKRPILSDLRESGAIEQDADIVMFLYRDDYYNDDSDKKGIVEITVAKHRNGETGTIEMVWKGEYMKFLNIER